MADPSNIPCADDIRSVIDEFDRRLDAIDTQFDVRLDNPSRALREVLDQVTGEIRSADISLLERDAGWWARFSGSRLKDEVKLQADINRIDAQIANARQIAAELKRRRLDFLSQAETLDKAIFALQELTDWAQSVHGSARRPKSGADEAWSLTRLETKLANLKTALVSHRIHAEQLKVTLRTVEFQLDVHTELDKKFYPVWKQYLSQLAQSEATPGTFPVTGAEIKQMNGKVRALLKGDGHRKAQPQ
ncbi:hypothetical protein WNY37_14730 [Henriciella sp. AS95]|uniref:hypothetical protein n=1 Tax=Henriciella sp. AS95 TaxID=3135782 RepID=UPI00317F79E3